jgi:hypothetical protein
MYLIQTRMIGLSYNPIDLQYFNIADMKPEYIKLGQSINNKLKKVNRAEEDLFLKYKIRNQKWIIQKMFILPNGMMQVWSNRENEQDTPLHIELPVPLIAENFELEIREIC